MVAGTLLVLDGVTRVDGFEIQAVGRIMPNWNVLFGYTHLKSEIRAVIGESFAGIF